MTDRVSNQMLNRQIHHLTQYLPHKEDLQGTPQGSGYFRKMNDDSFCEAFKRSHQQLNALKKRYELTDEQMSFINDAQLNLIHEIQEVYCHRESVPKSIQQFLNKRNGTG